MDGRTVNIKLGKLVQAVTSLDGARRRSERLYELFAPRAFDPVKAQQIIAKELSRRSINWAAVYTAGAYITGIITFIGCWIYAVAAYGLFLGIGLGWIPSLVIGFLAGILWPLIALIVIVGIALVIYVQQQH
jgi:hypothetical protein